MAVVFVVFLLAVVLVFLRPEGRARRLVRLRELTGRAREISRTVLARGTDAADRAAARLSADRRGVGLDHLLNGAAADRADRPGRSPEP